MISYFTGNEVVLSSRSIVHVFYWVDENVPNSNFQYFKNYHFLILSDIAKNGRHYWLNLVESKIQNGKAYSTMFDLVIDGFSA
jgi:hypothetical protein